MCQNAGFEIETSIGNRGTFYYPKLDLIATSLIIKDIKGLPCADSDFRDQIFAFIQTPSGTTVHTTPKEENIDIQYSIAIHTSQ